MRNATDADQNAADVVTVRCPAALVGSVVAALQLHGVLQYAMIEVMDDFAFEVVEDSGQELEFELVEEVEMEMGGSRPLESLGESVQAEQHLVHELADSSAAAPVPGALAGSLLGVGQAQRFYIGDPEEDDMEELPDGGSDLEMHLNGLDCQGSSFSGCIPAVVVPYYKDRERGGFLGWSGRPPGPSASATSGAAAATGAPLLTSTTTTACGAAEQRDAAMEAGITVPDFPTLSGSEDDEVSIDGNAMLAAGALGTWACRAKQAKLVRARLALGDFRIQRARHVLMQGAWKRWALRHGDGGAKPSSSNCVSES